MQQLPPQIGHYQIVRELGRGGMGVVYEGVDPRAGNRSVAIKLILGERDAGATDLLRFGREAEMLGRVNHPNVVRVHELSRCPQGPFLVTELVEGEELIHQLRAGPFEARRAAELCRLLADALAALHAQGIVHRDLKPHNVMVRPDGSPVLLDFGLARDVAAQRLTQTGMVVGTPAYMSPEQAEGASDHLDPRSDVYGLGAILFHLLAGTPPFRGGSHVQMLKRILLDDPTWPSLDTEHAPLLAILRQAMAKAPEARYPTVAELRDDLARFLSGEQVLAAPPVTTRRGVGLIVTGTLLALGLGLFFLVTAPHSRERPPTSVAPVESHVLLPDPTPDPTPRDERSSDPGLPARYTLEDRVGRSGLYRLARFISEDVVVSTMEVPADTLFVWRLGDDPRPSLETHAAPALRLALGRLGPDETFVVTAQAKNLVRFRFRQNGDLIEREAMALPRISCRLAVSADASVLFLGDFDGGFLRIPFGKRELVRALHSGGNPVGALLVSRDGNLVFTGSQDNDLGEGTTLDYWVKRWNAADLSPTETWHQVNVPLESMLCFVEAEDGTLLIGTAYHRILILRPGDKKPTALVSPDKTIAHVGTTGLVSMGEDRAHSAPVRGLALSPDGAFLYSVAGVSPNRPERGDLRVWDWKTGRQLAVVKLSNDDQVAQYTDLDLSPSGRRIVVSSSGGPIRVYELPPEYLGLKERTGD